jgi:hypothetical protein
MGNLEWHGKEAQELVHKKAVKAVTIICISITRRAKVLLSVAGTGKVKGKRVGKVKHAPAGQPPFKQTGRGRASVTYEVDDGSITGRAGTNVDYMKHQELGTKRGLKPHPWLRRAYDWTAAQVESILAPLQEP